MSFLSQCSHRIDSRAAEGGHDARHHGHGANYHRRACERDGVERSIPKSILPRKRVRPAAPASPSAMPTTASRPPCPSTRRTTPTDVARLDKKRVSPHVLRHAAGWDTSRSKPLKSICNETTVTEQVLAKTKTTRAGKLTPAGII